MSENTYTAIADEYRQRILTGELAPGTKLPGHRELATTHGAATATIGRALAQLQVEGIVRTTPRGTYVSDHPRLGISGADRLLRLSRAQSILMAGEVSHLSSASLVIPPLYVSDLYDIERPAQVLRREFTTHRGAGGADTMLHTTALIVTWHPAEIAELLPDLIHSESGWRAADVTARIVEATGRPIVRGRDDLEARDASEREATRLHIAPGSPVLALVWRWEDADGLIEYGECVMPAKRSVGYEYVFETGA